MARDEIHRPVALVCIIISVDLDFRLSPNQGFIQGGGKPGIPPQAEVPLPPRTAHQIELLDSIVMGGVGDSLPFGR